MAKGEWCWLANSKNWLQESRTVSNLVPSHCPVFPLCFSSVHLIEIAIILKIQPRMQIIAQKTGYKKGCQAICKLSWVENSMLVCFQMKQYNFLFFFFKVSNLVFPSCIVVRICMGEILTNANLSLWLSLPAPG